VLNETRYNELMKECLEKLEVLNKVFDDEVRKPLPRRRVQFLRFLEKERSTYTFGKFLLDQLKQD
jgi:hypothetical protein